MSSNFDYKLKYKVQYFIKIVFKLKDGYFPRRLHLSSPLLHLIKMKHS